MAVVRVTCVLLLMACYQASALDDVTAGTELVLSFLVHRHGDWTPVEAIMTFADPGQKELLNELIAPYGYGQLTNIGKRTAYKLGQFIRRRYNELLSPKFNRSEIYIRSTDSTRTKMTVLTAMAAVYPAIPGESWSEEINWVPVPYTTVPARYDFNLATANCPVFMNAMAALMMSPSIPAAEKYADVLSKLSEILNYDLSSYPALLYVINDLYVSQIKLGVDVGPEINSLYPELEVAAGKAMDIVFGNENFIGLQAGVLLKEFFDAATAVINGSETQKLRIYSAHDVNVYAFEAVTKVPRQGVPKYGSLYSLELRRDLKTGQYVVLPVYLSSPGDEEIYLPVEGCGGLLCDFEKFHELTSKYVMDEVSYRAKCGLTDETVIDTSSID